MRLPVWKFGFGAAICFVVLTAQVPTCLHAEKLSGSSAENTTLTEYDGERMVARGQVARVFADHEKWGFFRLGFMPLMVAQGVQIQIQSADCLTNVLADVSALNSISTAARHVEFRDLAISFFGDANVRVRAAKARFIVRAGVLELTDVSVPGADSIAKATLQISGPAAGTLRWRDGENERELFILKPPENPKP